MQFPERGSLFQDCVCPAQMPPRGKKDLPKQLGRGAAHFAAQIEREEQRRLGGAFPFQIRLDCRIVADTGQER